MTTYPNWFACYADKFFARHLMHLAGQPGLRFLQIGAFTGDASMWLVENVLTHETSQLTDVDTWAGSDEPEHEPIDFADVERVYRARVEPFRLELTIQPLKMTSQGFFSGQVLFDTAFDFIYIDGDHTAPAVLSDAVHAFEVLKPGGLLAFDDYQWKPYPDAPAHLAPGMAIDCFTACYQDRVVILEAGLQVWVRKLA
jgi:predicted O-methyltransferase YrrM